MAVDLPPSIRAPLVTGAADCVAFRPVTRPPLNAETPMVLMSAELAAASDSLREMPAHRADVAAELSIAPSPRAS